MNRADEPPVRRHGLFVGDDAPPPVRSVPLRLELLCLRDLPRPRNRRIDRQPELFAVFSQEELRLFDGCGGSGQHLPAGARSPAGLRRPVRDVDAAVRIQPEGAGHPVGPAFVEVRKLDDDGILRAFQNMRFALRRLELSVDQQDVVAEGADTEDFPAVGVLLRVPQLHAARQEIVVIVPADLLRPAHAVRLIDERTATIMAVRPARAPA